MARTPGPAPLCPGGGKAQLSSASPPGAGLLLPPPTPPPLLLLLFPLLFFSWLCGALAGPIIVEPHVTAVWGKNVSLKCLIEVNETITQISWEKIHGKSSQTVAVHHPQHGFSVQGEYQGRVLFKNYSINDATITLHNIGFSDSGKYICKAVTFPLGNAESSTTVTVLGALAGPIIVEPHVTAVWGKNVSLKCLIEVNETITQISWEKIHGKSSQTVAVHHPQHGFSVQGEYQGRVLFKNYSINDATITLHNIGFSDSGKYICKAVTFPLGNAESSTTVTVLVEPTVSLIKGPDSLIDGGNETVAAICIAATGKPVAHIDWEGDLGEMESTTTSFPNETATIVSQYKLFPTRFAKGRRITCVVKHPALEKDIRYSFILDIQYAPEVSVTGYDGNWFVGRKGVNLKCNADANPPPFKSVWSRLDGQWPDGLLASDNTLHFVHPLTFNYSGVYVCKVTNSLGQRSDQKVIYISDPPTTTTLQPTIQWHPSTADFKDLATEPKKLPFPLSTLATIKDDTIGTIIASVVGGALFIVLVSVLAGIFCYRRRRTFRGDYFAKNYIPPSDMQKESQIDVLQQDELDSYPDSVKKENKNPVNNLIRKDYLEEPEKTQWNNVENLNRFERPMDYYEDLKMGMKFVSDEQYDENEDDLVSHVDGSVISRREWYV
uniref:Nectin-3 n=2 Tax=Bos mutus grunniens TaxID=30521 RepID=A0A8C0A1D3_BOSMU